MLSKSLKEIIRSGKEKKNFTFGKAYRDDSLAP